MGQALVKNRYNHENIPVNPKILCEVYRVSVTHTHQFLLYYLADDMHELLYPNLILIDTPLYACHLANYPVMHLVKMIRLSLYLKYTNT